MVCVERCHALSLARTSHSVSVCVICEAIPVAMARIEVGVISHLPCCLRGHMLVKLGLSGALLSSRYGPCSLHALSIVLAMNVSS